MRASTKLLLFAITALAIAACSRSYSSQLFSFPSSSKPHENNWEYLGQIAVWDRAGYAPTQPVEKQVTVTIRDTDGNELLRDKLTITGGTFRHEVTWESLGDLRIESYGREPRTTQAVLAAQYSFKAGRFERVDADPESD